MNRNVFILPETHPPTSFDPLDADYSNNLHASQMLYRSILEIDTNNNLTSSLLKSFTYNPETNQIHFEVDENQTFSDGSFIKPEDIAFTIKRMILRRPTFPVIKHINGITQWLKNSNPLDEEIDGIQVFKSKIVIQFQRNINNPLFRFALPLFGVVKAHSVNRENKIFETSPTSGFYKLVERTKDKLTFRIPEHSGSKLKHLAREISILYLQKSIDTSLLSSLDQGSFIVLAQEQEKSVNEKNIYQDFNFERIEQPNSRFSAFLLNPNCQIFYNATCRMTFSDELRKEIAKTATHLQRESSLFSKILPGYLASETLEGLVPQDDSRTKCLKGFRGKTLRWMNSEGIGNQFFEKALLNLATKLDLKIATIPTQSPQDRYAAFARNELDILIGGSGFWAFDPVGDVQMLFTENLHVPLKFVASDAQVKNLLNNLEFEQNPNEKLKIFNRYIFSSALLNVYTHFKRVYFIKGHNVAKSIPVAVTPPTPWQLFYVSNR